MGFRLLDYTPDTDETIYMSRHWRSYHRRELAEWRRKRRKRLRLILALPFLTGLFVCGYVVIHGDPTGALTVIGAVLILPLICTFDLLGEAP